MAKKNLYFFVLAYAEEGALYYKNGSSIQVSCNHSKENVIYSITMDGKIVPLPDSTKPPGTTPGTQLQSGSALIPPGTMVPQQDFFVGGTSPNLYRIKDLDTLRTYFVDKTSYDSNVVNCNPAPYIVSCDATTATISNITTTQATVHPTFPAGAVGLEYIVNTSSSNPSTNGTYKPATTVAWDVTSLTTGTVYYVHIKTICNANQESAWSTAATFTTS